MDSSAVLRNKTPVPPRSSPQLADALSLTACPRSGHTAECAGLRVGRSLWKSQGEPGPEDAVVSTDAGPTTGSVVDAQLMPEREVLDLEGGAGSEGGADRTEQRGKPIHSTGILRFGGLLSGIAMRWGCRAGRPMASGISGGPIRFLRLPGKSSRSRPMWFSGRTGFRDAHRQSPTLPALRLRTVPD